LYICKYTYKCRERERDLHACPPWPEVGKGRIVAESTSPVGRGTAGLLLIKGIPSLLSGTNDGTVTGELAVGAGLGGAAWRGWKGQANAGEDDTTPPEDGAGAATGGSSGGIAEASGGGVEDTFMESFSEAWHAFRDPLLKAK
jgi:hypothetical protein